MKLWGRIAIVTGASSGIGAATAEALAQKGATVVALARRKDLLEEVVGRCQDPSPESMSMVVDVADRSECEEAVEAAEQRYGRVDVVVNNAGISLRRHGGEASVEEIEEVMRVNYFGAVYLTMRALPGMLERKTGSIVNVTSVAGYVPTPHESAYGASKAALSMWSHALAVDLHGSGVHVGVMSPGPIDTEIWAKDIEDAAYAGKKYPPQVIAQGIVSMIEGEKVHMTVPRQYGLVGKMYPWFGAPMRYGLRRFEEKAGHRRTRRAGDATGREAPGDDAT